jgi:hypothetical protein
MIWPYLILCDDGSNLKAPEDTDLVIQKLHDEAPVFGPLPDRPKEDPEKLAREEALFGDVPPEDDCPVCGLRYPMKNGTCTHKYCCAISSSFPQSSNLT